MKSALAFGTMLVASFVSLSAQKPAQVMAPYFEVDPYWPKPLPNHWVVGSTIGVCCKVAPPVLEFDQDGNLVGSWGGPGDGYEWPVSNHGITADSKGNVWIGGNDNTDTQILKFTRTGKFLQQIGKHGVHNGSNDTG